MNWYPFYSGDYARDTAHLSMMEHGAFRLLLDHYYNTQSPLPADRGKLYRVCRAVDDGEKAAIDAVLGMFFTETAEGWRNNKADQVIEQQAKKAEVNRERAMKAVDAKRSKSATPSSTTSTTPSTPSQSQSQSTEPEVREPEPPPQPKGEKPVVVADENPISLEDLTTLYTWHHGRPEIHQQADLIKIADKFTSSAIVEAVETAVRRRALPDSKENAAAWILSRLERKPGSYLFEKDPENAYLKDLPSKEEIEAENKAAAAKKATAALHVDSSVKPAGYFACGFPDRSDEW